MTISYMLHFLFIFRERNIKYASTTIIRVTVTTVFHMPVDSSCISKLLLPAIKVLLH